MSTTVKTSRLTATKDGVSADTDMEHLSAEVEALFDMHGGGKADIGRIVEQMLEMVLREYDGDSTISARSQIDMKNQWGNTVELLLTVKLRPPGTADDDG